MSNDNDERNIDEVLASLDAMLAEAQASSSSLDTRKDVVDQAGHRSEEKLSVSSAVDHDKIFTEKATQEEDDTEDSPRQRIVLTEAYLEPAAHESIPLWAVQHTVQSDASKSTPQVEKVDASSKEEDKTTTSKNLSTNFSSVDHENWVDALDELSELEDISGIANTNESNAKPEQENCIQGIIVIDDEEEDAAEIHLEKDTATLALKMKESKQTDDVEAVFETTARNEIFDISEAMNEDALYDFEVLDHELVEALDKRSAQENELKLDESNVEESCNVNKTTHQETIIDDVVKQNHEVQSQEHALEEVANASHKQVDAAVYAQQEDNEPAEMAKTDCTESAEYTEKPTQTSDTILLNPDELDPLIESICDDVRIKINQHLQQILPELISEALLEHLANQQEPTQD